MNAEPRSVDLGAEPAELVDAAILLSLAIDGLKANCPHCEVSDWTAEALQFGARLVLDRAERVAAEVANRPTRWMTGLPNAYANGEREKAEAGES